MSQVESDRELIGAVLRGDLDLAERMIDRGANVNPALHALCLSKSSDAFRMVAGKFLVDRGADVNTVSDEGNTLLHIVDCDVPIMKFLIGHGADVNLKNSDGYTALLKHCREGSLTSIRTLLKADASEETIKEALGFVLDAPAKSVSHAKIILEFLEQAGISPDGEFGGKPILDYFDEQWAAARGLIEEAQRQHRSVQMWDSLSSAMGKGGDLSGFSSSSSGPSM
jgi:hypothetical protein